MDLNAPLGKRPPPPRRRRAVPIVLAALAAVASIGIGVYLLQADPHGGEPYAVALVPPPPQPRTQTPQTTTAPADPMPTGSIPAPTAARPPDTSTMENGVNVVSPASGSATARHTGPLIIDVTKALDGDDRRKPSPGRTAEIEVLPKVVTGGPTGGAARPRVAIFVGGLGLSEIATRTAVETMPVAVDLAFVPYGATLAPSIATARERGHEILLQLPMRGPQGAALGPHTLGPDETAADMASDLAWLTSRFDGYAGVTNLLGASVTARPDAMSAILSATSRRGAFYVDDGTSRRSTAASVAAGLGVPVVQADVVLDATADPAILRANLERLVAIAHAKGSAVGMASALSDHVAAVARFASELDARGVSLVPVGAIARGLPNVAATTR